MATYNVPVVQTVSTVVEIEADSRLEAIDKFYKQGLPHLMFGDYTYPDEGDWEVDEDYSNGKLED